MALCIQWEEGAREHRAHSKPQFDVVYKLIVEYLCVLTLALGNCVGIV